MSIDPLYKFGPVWCASGVKGWFGEGYWYHSWFKFLFPRVFTFDGMTFVAKTTTLGPREGNMPFDEETLKPIELFPKSIEITLRSWLRGCALNAIGLSGPGAHKLFMRKREWQEIEEPFMLSFMSVAETKEMRLKELQKFVVLLDKHLADFKVRIALQINLSCPNTGHDLEEIAGETSEMLFITSKLEIPVIVKINCLMPVDLGLEIAAHPFCHGLCVGNTYPYQNLPTNIQEECFVGNISPLQDRVGSSGGFSGGDFLREENCLWIDNFRSHDKTSHINGCGGIRKPAHVFEYHESGASSISLGSIAFLRPWRMRACIQKAQELFS